MLLCYAVLCLLNMYVFRRSRKNTGYHLMLLSVCSLVYMKASSDLCPVLSCITFSGTPVAYIGVTNVVRIL